MPNSRRLAENVRKQVVLRAQEIERREHDDNLIQTLTENHNLAVQALLSLEAEDQNWIPWNQYFADNDERDIFTLQQTQDIARKCEEFTKSNPTLGNGFRLRTNYTFGRGFQFEYDRGELPPRFRRIVEDAENEAAVFGNTAYRNHNRSLFSSGNLLGLYDTETKKASIVPFSLVTSRLSHEIDRSQLKYIQITYQKQNDLSAAGEPTESVIEWIPTDGYWLSNDRGRKLKGVRLPAGPEGKTIAVSHTKVIIDLRVNRGEGDVWGIPDCFAAVPWALGYSSYLKDGSKMLKALSAIAMHVRAKTTTAAKNMGARIERNRVGGTAITGPDTEVSVIPRSNAVDLYTGRPILAMAASALSVSVTPLSSDTGRGGSYGSEATLELPELLATLARQEEFADWTRRFFAVMGIDDGNQNFARISTDPVHRQIQSLVAARVMGHIDQREGRVATLELLDIVGDPHDLPIPDQFTGSKYASLEGAVVADALNTDNVDDPLPRQGNSGAFGSVTDNNELTATDNANVL